MKEKLAQAIAHALDGEMGAAEVEALLEVPKHEQLGDLAFPCFTLAKKFKKAPALIASELAGKLAGDFIGHVKVENAYLNIFFDQLQIAKGVIEEVLTEDQAYGGKQVNGQKVLLDYSSPNIAKPFSMGHLRSTVIGQALANISEKQGYEAVRINHLGDWGTQFGKLIVAYRLWGDKTAIEQNPIAELLAIYVKFHEQAESDESLNEQARAAFKSLEDGDAEAGALWKWFREASLKEFEQVYEMLGVSFDLYQGEAFYNDKMDRVVDELTAGGLLEPSDGAMVVPLEEMPPCLIKKKDGATLYATRDLAAAIYRYNTYQPAKVFYVVGHEQSLHFEQVFKVLEKMGYTWHDRLTHIPFGMVLQDGKKMSTRKGKIVLLADVLKETIEAAKQKIEEKNPALENKEEVARDVGIGAVVFNDLKNDRMSDIEFSIDEMIKFEGDTGLYVQYTNARIQTLLQKGGFAESGSQLSELDGEAWSTVKILAAFPETVEKSFEQASPSVIAKYSLNLARAFNKYYGSVKFLTGGEEENDRLKIAYATSVVLQESLRLLGVNAPRKM